jgi:FtsP/CotA-like multicopper oxidase with cupredoxin domain
VYHSHLNDVNQLTKGMYGPMIVLGENEIYNPELDHFYILGWKSPFPQSDKDVDINGWEEIPVQHAKMGETHRLRLINIGPAGNVNLRFTKNGKKYLIKSIAKDGADLPISQQVRLEESPKVYVGEAADFSFTPEEPGIYELKFNFWPANWTQVWEVSDK